MTDQAFVDQWGGSLGTKQADLMLEEVRALVREAKAQSEAPLVTALREALEDFENAFDRLTPTDGPMREVHTPEGVAQAIWFGMERIRRALSGSVPQPPTSPDEQTLAKLLQQIGYPIVGGAWHGKNARDYARRLLAALAASQEPSTGDDR